MCKVCLIVSLFGNVLGFWKVGRVELWEEKLGFCKLFVGNEVIIWGIN